jgi:hypothetical protein
VYADLEGEENYADFIRTLNAVIAKYAVKHHHHRNHHGNAGAENVQPQQTTEPSHSTIGEKQ